MRKVLFILGQLTDSDVDWLTTAGRKERVPAGKVLIQEHKKIEKLYIVLEGLLSVTDAHLGGREIARLEAGEIVGEMSFVSADLPVATVTALQDTQVLSLPTASLSVKLEQDPGFAARFYRAIAVFLSDRLRATVGTLGYGEVQPPEDLDKLDENVLDNVHLAGARFERMLKKLTINRVK